MLMSSYRCGHLWLNPMGDLWETLENTPRGGPPSEVRKQEAGLCTQKPWYDSLRALPGLINTPARPGEDGGAHSSSCTNPSSYQHLQSEAFRELQNGEREGAWVEH